MTSSRIAADGSDIPAAANPMRANWLTSFRWVVESSRIRAPSIAACAARSCAVNSASLTFAVGSARMSSLTTQAAVVGRRAAAITRAASPSPRSLAAVASALRSAVNSSGGTP
ncbi:hypothetical protein C6A86_011225 [Mycobacterium sp. ITM-2016-00316]|uniref:hypothetical protein n=1 Tax=Mycobacterium sp. ITM-2016-00316 TaxID=2099695 RepID=UPI00115892BA|nr:hypothetical protein [Mycobacterium sp. ITM-2016-00316]WNG84158.1 hypothetical protein C6A86_011225 [Mycobacterium sp. ITM-2016-00316]